MSASGPPKKDPEGYALHWIKTNLATNPGTTREEIGSRLPTMSDDLFKGYVKIYAESRAALTVAEKSSNAALISQVDKAVETQINARYSPQALGAGLEKSKNWLEGYKSFVLPDALGGTFASRSWAVKEGSDPFESARIAAQRCNDAAAVYQQSASFVKQPKEGPQVHQAVAENLKSLQTVVKEFETELANRKPVVKGPTLRADTLAMIQKAEVETQIVKTGLEKTQQTLGQAAVSLQRAAPPPAPTAPPPPVAAAAKVEIPSRDSYEKAVRSLTAGLDAREAALRAASPKLADALPKASGPVTEDAFEAAKARIAARAKAAEAATTAKPASPVAPAAAAAAAAAAKPASPTAASNSGPQSPASGSSSTRDRGYIQRSGMESLGGMSARLNAASPAAAKESTAKVDAEPPSRKFGR